VDFRVTPGPGKRDVIEFRVRWERYGPEDDTWEPEENLT